MADFFDRLEAETESVSASFFDIPCSAKNYKIAPALTDYNLSTVFAVDYGPLQLEDFVHEMREEVQKLCAYHPE